IASEGVLAPPACARAPVIGGRHRHSLPMRPGDNIIPVPTALFMVQVKSECHFSNSTRQVHFLDRYIYNREELVRFDSHVGEDLAVSELGRPAAELWNRQKDALQRARAAVHTFCRINKLTVSLAIPSTFSLLLEPTVTVYPAKTQPLWHHSLLVCSVNGFYPGHTEVRCFQNGLIPNGDWTFQTMVMLEIVPQSGEVYTCHVEHPSWTSPVTVEWRTRCEPPRDKMLSRIGACVMGLLFPGVGLLLIGH
uniref:Ig-like domain-containing protein n=1 Tax=Phocoena sinus TaxID=42100 RepID=A0A8C9CHD2_PHOSS